jgi:tetratricopeptide (TPR) repeat protein/transcriptional regulator with XRE-family HTH domain
VAGTTGALNWYGLSLTVTNQTVEADNRQLAGSSKGGPMGTGGDSGPDPAGPTSLAGLLRAARDRALLTQEELAQRSGLSVRTIRDLETGRVGRPRSGSMRLLADALGLTEQERAALVAAVQREPGRPAPTVPAQLPADVGQFTGRIDQLKRLDELLPGEPAGGPGAVVISAIAGTAGVGKTALAIHWAHTVADRFPDGQLFVNLRGYAPTPPLQPIQALAQLLAGLGVEPDRVPSGLEEAAGLYRSLLAGRRVLVVLDNAHHPDQVRPLLPGAPGCVVVVTSRDRLSGLVASHGARRLALDVLTPDEATRLLARILGDTLVAAEPEATAALARACAYLPLALRIAAANVADRPGSSQRPIAAYVAELGAGGRLDMLAVDGDAHGAVRAAFDLSYQRLALPARRLFRLLGLVPGPDVTAEAAAALAGITPVRAARLLGQLAGAHLLDQHVQGRYAFHDLLRDYAAERARHDDSGQDRDAAVGRLFDLYLASSDAAARLLRPGMVRLPMPTAVSQAPAAAFGKPSQAVGWLDAELPNLLAAIQHAAAHGPRPVAWLLTDALRGYLYLRAPYVIDQLNAAGAALAAAEAAGDLRAQAAAQLSLADAYEAQTQYQRAIDHYTRVLTLAQQSGWLDGQAAAHGNLGAVYQQSGLPEKAMNHYTRSLELSRQLGRIAGQATVLGNVGILSFDLGRLEAAADYHTQAMALASGTESRSMEAIDISNRGAARHALGQLDAAREDLTRALTLTRELGDRRVQAFALSVLAEVHRDAGRHPLALELASDALAVAREIGDRRMHAEALNAVATIHQQRHDHQAALDGHRRALALSRETKAHYATVGALVGLATASRYLDRLDQARILAHQARALASQAGYRVLQGQALTALAEVCLAEGDIDQAAEHADEALDIQQSTGHRLGQARTLLALGQALHHSQRTEAALACWKQAHKLFATIGTPEADEVRSLLATHQALDEDASAPSTA